MEKKFFTIEEVVEKLRNYPAKFWVVTDVVSKEQIYSADPIRNGSEIPFDDMANKFVEQLSGMDGSYKVEYYRNNNGVKEIPSVVYMQIGEVKQVSNVGSFDFSSVTGAIKDELRSEYRTQANEQIESFKEILKRENEVYKLNRDIEDYKAKIGSLTKENNDLRRQNEDLNKSLANDSFQKVEKFVNIAEPYIKMFLMSRGQQQSAVQGTQQAQQAQAQDGNDFDLNIPSEKSERFISAVNEWAMFEPNVTEIIESIVELHKNEPNVYNMALGSLIK